jgi:AraC family transcriptional regulator
MFLGETLDLRHISGIMLSENVYAAREDVPRHTHEASFFSLTLSGGYLERHDAGDIDYGVGSVSFHPAGDEHALKFGADPTRCLNVELGDEWLRTLEGLSERDELLRLENGPLLWLSARLFAAFRSSFDAADSIENLVLEMVGCVAGIHDDPRNAREPIWLGAIDEMLRAEYFTGVTVFDLARRVGVHPVHLSRTWRRYRGASIPRTVQRMRVDAACRLLSEGEMPLVDLALQVGFADQSHFSNVFKTFTGMTPGAYQRMFGIHKNALRPSA